METSDIITAIVAVVGAVAGSGFLGVIINGMFARRRSEAEAEKFRAEAAKLNAEAADQMTETALGLLKEMEREQDELKIEVKSLQAIAAENHKFQIAFIIIEDQVRQAKMKPAVTLRDLPRMSLDDLMSLAEARDIRLPRLAR
ncbi:MAG: hypothetical protein V3R81_11005 [Gammaproteobacteria bacterium]